MAGLNSFSLEALNGRNVPFSQCIGSDAFTGLTSGDRVDLSGAPDGATAALISLSAKIPPTGNFAGVLVADTIGSAGTFAGITWNNPSAVFYCESTDFLRGLEINVRSTGITDCDVYVQYF